MPSQNALNLSGTPTKKSRTLLGEAQLASTNQENVRRQCRIMMAATGSVRLWLSCFPDIERSGLPTVSFSLFTEPAYFPQLVTPHPCFLVGGRGTGKTTALKCLSYEGLRQLEGRRPDDARDWPYYGMYYRVNTNRVKAFHGAELANDQWAQLFAHYINLEFCDLALQFLEWFSGQAPDCPRLSTEALNKVAIALHVNGEIRSHGDLVDALELSRLQFEAAINNVGEIERMPNLSMQGAPVDLILKEIRSLPQFTGKTFFFLIDEYENFDALQQRVVNTLIKHCGQFYSFKVGVREFGFRERGTLNDLEDLKHPADYKLIDVVEELLDGNRFSSFASQVCNVRLAKAFGDVDTVPAVEALLPELDWVRLFFVGVPERFRAFCDGMVRVT